MLRLLLVSLFSLSLSVMGLQANEEMSHGDHASSDAKKEFSIAELSKFNGKNGQKAYIAIDGVVYDVTNAEDWKDGVHLPTEGKLMAGIDASEIILKSPHGKKVLKELPVVGSLKK